MTAITDIYSLFLQSAGVCTDSRNMAPGMIFFALKGDNFDGNRYAAAAIGAGASAAVIDDRRVAESIGEGGKCIVVEDSLITLRQLAAHHRRELGIPIIAITGSNGKTTTKELLERTLSKKYRTAATKGNLNNHIGVPLTLLSMDRGTEFGIVEMGANHKGEIALLCDIASPDYGIITNIGRAHLEGFGGVEGVKKGKGELFDFLACKGGTAFYLRENPDLASMVLSHKGLNAIPYDRSRFETVAGEQFLTLKRGTDEIRTHMVGEYNLYNIAAAFAVGEFFGISDNDIIAAIESYIPDNNRSQRIETARNTLVMDAYNANPSSMRAALENFAAQKSTRLKMVILGEMYELGEYSLREHGNMIDLISKLGLKEVYLVGKEFEKAAAGRYPVFGSAAELAEYFSGNPVSGKFILIKGSRGVGLEIISEVL